MMQERECERLLSVCETVLAEARDVEDEGMSKDEQREMPEVWLSALGPCGMCGKPDQRHGCFKCGRPVCMDESNYMADSACGGWILDWWSNGAMDPDDGNEFWCQACLAEEYGKPRVRGER